MSIPNQVLQQAYSAHTQGQLTQAVSHYHQVLAQDPAHAEANYGLGLALYDLGHYPDARARFRVAVGRNSAYPEAHFGLALVEKAMGNYDEAFSHFREARRLRHDYADAIAVEADLLELVGRKQEAHDLILPLLNSGIVNTNLAITFAKVARHFGMEERALAELRRSLDVPNLALAHRRELHYELGRRFDAQNRYDEAFNHFQEANRLKGAVYDRNRQRLMVDEMIETFARKGFPDYTRASNTSDLPVFIVGMPRSGTSLVESILASHPAVFGAGELDFIGHFVKSASLNIAGRKNLREVLRGLDNAATDRVANEYLAQLLSLSKSKPSAKRVTDKLPYNFFRLGMFALLFPGARIIHCTRDPRDTCLSIYFQNFTGRHDYASDLSDIGHYYREYLRLMSHWRQVGALPMLDVQYESLVSSPETELPRIVDFCGLPWDEACARFHDSGRVTKTASYDQVRRPLYDSSVGRWRSFQKHLRPLFLALGDCIS